GREQLANLLSQFEPGKEIKLEVIRKEGKKTETLTAKLDVMPSTTPEKDGGMVPEKLPDLASAKRALEPLKAIGGGPKPKEDPKDDKKDDKKDGKKDDKKKEKAETGLLKRMNAARDHHYWVYVPDDYDPNISYALLVWLHPTGKNKEK